MPAMPFEALGSDTFIPLSFVQGLANRTLEST